MARHPADGQTGKYLPPGSEDDKDKNDRDAGMFTGLITDIGKILSVEECSGGRRLKVETGFDTSSFDIGASVAHSGVCLTLIETGVAEGTGKGWWIVECSAETLSCTTIGSWQAGTRVNLERSLRMGDELGGHFVFGHVDGMTTLAEIKPDGDSLRLTFVPPARLMPFMAPKGSVSLDGISLTVNGVGEDRFDVNIIPHTQEMTTLSDRKEGDALNMEIDMLARYVGRLMACGGGDAGDLAALTRKA